MGIGEGTGTITDDPGTSTMENKVESGCSGCSCGRGCFGCHCGGEARDVGEITIGDGTGAVTDEPGTSTIEKKVESGCPGCSCGGGCFGCHCGGEARDVGEITIGEGPGNSITVTDDPGTSTMENKVESGCQGCSCRRGCIGCHCGGEARDVGEIIIGDGAGTITDDPGTSTMEKNVESGCPGCSCGRGCFGCHCGGEATKGITDTQKPQLATTANQEKVASFEEAFDRIQAATGISDIDELVQTFLDSEDGNFGLFKYDNLVRAEI